MIGKLLGHTQVQTTARYVHLASDPMKKAANKIADPLASALFGKLNSAYTQQNRTDLNDPSAISLM